MIVNPDLDFMKTHTTSHVHPIPTVHPGPSHHVEKAMEVGNRTLWVVTVMMAISSLAFYGMAFRVPAQKRLFHIITAFITTFAFLSYFAMSVGEGKNFKRTWVKIDNEFVPPTYKIYFREVYWARYVDWTLTTPLLLLDLCLLAGLSGANILVAIVADVIMVITGLFAAYGHDNGQKWGWYAWGCIAYLVIVYQVVVNGRTAVTNKDSKTKAFFGALAAFTFILWTVYPIVWAVAEGSRKISVDAEIIAYAVLDILAKPVFGFWLLFTHDSMSSTSPSLEGFWSHGWGGQGSLRVGDDDEA